MPTKNQIRPHVVGTEAALTRSSLRRQSSGYRGTGGVSEENHGYGFAPAFLDVETGIIYLARFANGNPAPMHLMDGLPDELILSRAESGAINAIKGTVIAGFLRQDRFFTREQAARAVRQAARIRARADQSSSQPPELISSLPSH
jgi:hypothetical protein